MNSDAFRHSVLQRKGRGQRDQKAQLWDLLTGQVSQEGQASLFHPTSLPFFLGTGEILPVKELCLEEGICSSGKTTWLPINHIASAPLSLSSYLLPLRGKEASRWAWTQEGACSAPPSKEGSSKPECAHSTAYSWAPPPKIPHWGDDAKKLHLISIPKRFYPHLGEILLEWQLMWESWSRMRPWVQEVVGVWGNSTFLETRCLFWSFALRWLSCHLSDHSLYPPLSMMKFLWGELKGEDRLASHWRPPNFLASHGFTNCELIKVARRRSGGSAPVF